MKDFADAIRGELNEMRTPTANDELLARILESRRSGHRIILPTEDARPRRSLFFYGSAVAAAAIAIVLFSQLTRPRSHGPDEWFVSERAFAQTPAVLRTPAYPGARVTAATRMRPMTLHYTRTLRDSAGTASYDVALDVRRDVVNSIPAWRMVSAMQLPHSTLETDSVWVSAASFQLLQRTLTTAPYHKYERIAVRQSVDALHLTGGMNAFRNGRVDAHRTFDRKLPGTFAPYIADSFAPLYFMGVATDHSWKGSIALLGWAVRDNDVFMPVNMRVEGEELVRVPAGEFACWRIALEIGGRSQLYWIRKSDGLGVRGLDTSGSKNGRVRDIVLQSVSVNSTRP